MRIGAHVSISGGVRNAPGNGTNLGCEVIQIFSKNQQQWAAKPLDPADAQAFKEGVAAAKLGPTLIHCSYLLNLASPDDALWERSIDGLVVEVERAEALGVPFVVFHPGSPKDKPREWGLERVGFGLAKVLERTKRLRAMVLIETNAGAGNAVGRTFEELAAIIAKAGHHARLGVCLDTCHVFVSGYDIRTKDGYEAMVASFDRAVGLDRLKAFHLNDSKGELGSNRDRHENIGKGLLGEVLFQELLRDPRFKDHPGYIETPYEEDGDYVRDLARLRELREGAKAKPPPSGGQQTLFGGDAAPAAKPKAAKKPAQKPAKGKAR
ncbi:MAG TPA: deoxyribonuclease IV [Candidatus Thermoplasmatota archaeon]|nr:deoxyribonuclease IV [Candidatus Thermoplasmatota archaeon]